MSYYRKGMVLDQEFLYSLPQTFVKLSFGRHSVQPQSTLGVVSKSDFFLVASEFSDSLVRLV
jgi:hypothetical protein